MTANKIAELLSKMSLPSKALNDGKVEVEVGPTRHDILHPCDIVEDVAIAYGYNNIEKTMPKSMTIASQQPINKLTDLLRQSVSQSGFTEALNFQPLLERRPFGSTEETESDSRSSSHFQPQNARVSSRQDNVASGSFKDGSGQPDDAVATPSVRNLGRCPSRQHQGRGSQETNATSALSITTKVPSSRWCMACWTGLCSYWKFRPCLRAIWPVITSRAATMKRFFPGRLRGNHCLRFVRGKIGRLTSGDCDQVRLDVARFGHGNQLGTVPLS